MNRNNKLTKILVTYQQLIVGEFSINCYQAIESKYEPNLFIEKEKFIQDLGGNLETFNRVVSSKRGRLALPERLRTYTVVYNSVSIDTISLGDAEKVLTLFSTKKKAFQLLVTLGVGGLVTLVKNLFQIPTTLENEIERVNARLKNKAVRRTFTDSVKDYINRHANDKNPDGTLVINDVKKKFYWNHINDALTICLYDKGTRAIKNHLLEHRKITYRNK